jgi:hypothetical protein
VRSKRGKTNKMWTRTEEEVLQQFRRQPVTPPEILWHALFLLTDATFQMCELFRTWRAFDLAAGEFFNEKLVFDERALPIGRTAHFQALKYDTFLKDAASTNDPSLDQPVLKELTSLFNRAKTELADYVKAGGSKENPRFRRAFASAVTNLALLPKVTRDKRFTVDPQKGMLFPHFKICT